MQLGRYLNFLGKMSKIEFIDKISLFFRQKIDFRKMLKMNQDEPQKIGNSDRNFC